QGTWWLADHLGLAGGVGRHPPDPGLLATGGNFVRLGFRVALDRRGTGPAAPEGAAAAAFQARREGSLVALELQAPGAARVELMADFTDWTPVVLEPVSPGRWRIRLPIPPGLHYVNVRYDGGVWQAPPATRVILDDFHRETGIVVVG
ncbi:MAG TPA: glycogen-binding domain-containing protein, partial [Gemmatimonadales bacterium]|nr:glycogen-binding domain-containing protein [Gemmatimonadales bacterium]